MNITLENAGKKFFGNWVFKQLSLHIPSKYKLVVLGPNGSGKSTLLQILSGQLSLSAGQINFGHLPEEVFSRVTICAPYLDMIEDFTLNEIIKFHFKFKKPARNLSHNDIVDITGLKDSQEKVFKYFSSGMKQRVKLTLAILSDVDMVLLDEPLTNLDSAGVEWYKKLTAQYLADKTVIVASNHDRNEYSFCEKELDIMNYK